MSLRVACISGLLLLPLITSAKFPSAEPDARIPYAERNTRTLHLNVYRPEGWKPIDRRPAVVFYFGGGWKGGSPAQFSRHARVLADHGLVAVTAEYRTSGQDQTTPFECVQDAKAALRFLHRHASEQGIDPARLGAGGGSAGGHLAAATAFVEAWDEPGVDAPMPNPAVLLLFNPVVDNGPKGYGMKRLGDRWKEFSPLHNVKAPAPPTLFFLGEKDRLIPVRVAHDFTRALLEAGSPLVQVHLTPGAGHGYFNQDPHYARTVEQMVDFLRQLGWIAPATDR